MMTLQRKGDAARQEYTTNKQKENGTAPKQNEKTNGEKVLKKKVSEWAHLQTEIEFVIGAAGIYLFYLLYGILQERVTTTPFGENQERFRYIFFLVCVQCIFSAVLAAFVLFCRNLKQKSSSSGSVRSGSSPPFTSFAIIALTYVLAMFCSNSSLQFVDYPTQVLAKSCKPIPVMLVAVLFYGKRYHWQKWLTIILISAGIALFMFQPGRSHAGKGHEAVSVTEYVWGYLLLIASLFFDGLTGPAQERLCEKYDPKPSSVQLMLNCNLWAILYMAIGVFVAGEGQTATSFCVRHPEILWLIFLLAVCSALGQFFIYFTLHRFGSLALTVVTTTRKFFTILASVIWFAHELSLQKWCGVSLVFVGLGFDMFNSYLSKRLKRI
jgi:UDP-galactose transporter B1